MLFFALVNVSAATHVVGGEIYYTALAGHHYLVTLKVYRDCGPTNINGTNFDDPAAIGVFESNTGDQFGDTLSVSLAFAQVDFVPIVLENPCFILPPDVCVERAVYTYDVYLPDLDGGYDLVYQRCCRNPSIVNLDFPEDQGATFTTHIPGPDEIAGGNSSAQFTNFPPVALCQNAEFFFDHSATDIDGDSLSYEFCSPMLGGTPDAPAPVPPLGPPFTSIDWGPEFSPTYPIASDPAFNVDPITGFMTGTATELGQYVLGVCVSEYRDGVLINTTNRDFQFNVTVCDPNIIAAIPEQTDFCDGLTIQFENTSTNATFFLWDFGVEGATDDISTLASPTYTYSDSGVYVVTMIANPGWPCADTAYSTFSALPVINPHIVIGDYECIDHQDFYDFSMTGSVSSVATFNWDFGAGSIPQFSNENSPDNIQMNPEALSMNITLEVIDNGCVESDDETVSNPPDPVSAIVPQETFCDGYQYQFENNAQNATSYLWNFGAPGAGDISDDPSPMYTYSDTGHYQIMLVISAPFTCSDTSYMNFQIYGMLDPSFEEQDPQCLDVNSFDFEGLGASTDDALYSWDFGSLANQPFSIQQNPQDITYSAADWYPITLTISENDCVESYTDSVWVASHFIMDFDIENSQGCPDLYVQLHADAISDSPVFYNWDFGDGTSSTQGDTYHTYTHPGTYDVTVTSFTNTGCQDHLTQVFPGAVVVHPSPVAGFTITPPIVNILDPVVFIEDISMGSVACRYYMSDGGESEECSFSYEWTEAGMQSVTQYVTNEFGCVSHMLGTVAIEGFLFFAPNSFTPNSDGLNDFWLPEMTGITDYELKIFSRWGDMIFESTDNTMPWTGQVRDGTYFAQDGVYNYIVRVHDLMLYPHEFQGHITLVR